jgi:hypothetical protein
VDDATDESTEPETALLLGGGVMLHFSVGADISSWKKWHQGDTLTVGELGVSQWLTMLEIKMQAMIRAWEMLVDGEREEEEEEGNGRDISSRLSQW